VVLTLLSSGLCRTDKSCLEELPASMLRVAKPQKAVALSTRSLLQCAYPSADIVLAVTFTSGEAAVRIS
jgi:hypothetical protein